MAEDGDGVDAASAPPPARGNPQAGWTLPRENNITVIPNLIAFIQSFVLPRWSLLVFPLSFSI
jgi:hypothetical protein